jgi:hypothetical protein
MKNAPPQVNVRYIVFVKNHVILRAWFESKIVEKNY